MSRLRAASNEALSAQQAESAVENKGRPVDVDLDVCCCTSLRRAARKVSQLYNQKLSPVGLRATQFAILVAVAQESGISIRSLGARLDLDSTTTSRNIRPLERRGLIIVRHSNHDARIRTICLSKAGVRMLASAVPLWREAQEEFSFKNGLAGAESLRSLLVGLAV